MANTFALTAREAYALHLRKDVDMTLDQVGKELGCSRERARVLIRHAEWKLNRPSPDPLSIDSLGLTTHARNALFRSGIRTISQLVELSPDAVLSIRTIGPIYLGEIMVKLADRGYHLGEFISEEVE